MRQGTKIYRAGEPTPGIRAPLENMVSTTDVT